MSQIEHILKDASLKVTPVRREVLRHFFSNDFALSFGELEGAVEADRVTLYRTLKSFEQKGIVHKVVDGTGVDKYAVCEHHCDDKHHHDDHVHFNCGRCGNTFCIEESNMPHIKMPQGFIAKNTNIVVQGLCDKCS